jgi:hypothetical protein
MKLSECDLLPHKVNIQLNVLRAPMMDRVARHVDAGDVVAVGHRCLGDAAVELTEKMPEPSTFGDGVGDSTILRFSA